VNPAHGISEKSAGLGMANSVTRLCHNCAMNPAHAAQVNIIDSSRLLIPCKLQKLRGGPDNPAYTNNHCSLPPQSGDVFPPLFLLEFRDLLQRNRARHQKDYHHRAQCARGGPIRRDLWRVGCERQP
jgi:hypothetical protein